MVSTAEDATNWRKYLTAYPFVALGAAMVIGYLIVPGRSGAAAIPVGDVVREDVAKLHELVASASETVNQASKAIKPKKGLIAAAIGLAAPLVFRTAQGYAMKYLENWILQQQMSHPVSGSLIVPRDDPASDAPRQPRKGGVSP